MRGLKRGENDEPLIKVTAFQKAEALAGHRHHRDKLLAMFDEVTTHFRMPNSFERSKIRAVCRYLADDLDRCNGSGLQQRWNDFETGFGRSGRLASIVEARSIGLGVHAS